MFPDNILDIKFCNGQSYLLREHTWTTEKLISQIKHYKYTGMNREKDEAVEHAKLPSIAALFYKHIFLYDDIPNEDELIEEYLKKYFNRMFDSRYTLKKNYRTTELYFNRDGIEARVLRAYPSLIRDFHFYLYCYESNMFEEVVYSLEDDCHSGVDLILMYHDRYYCVSLYTATRRGKEFKKQKYFRHDYSHMEEIQIEIDLKNCRTKVGPFKLYDKKYFDQLMDKIYEYEGGLK